VPRALNISGSLWIFVKGWSALRAISSLKNLHEPPCSSCCNCKRIDGCSRRLDFPTGASVVFRAEMHSFMRDLAMSQGRLMRRGSTFEAKARTITQRHDLGSRDAQFEPPRSRSLCSSGMSIRRLAHHGIICAGRPGQLNLATGGR
jgi:hypothetical protein